MVAGDTEGKAETTRGVEWSGVGVNLRSAHPEVAAIAAAVDEVLSVPSYRERAQELQAEVAAAPGVAALEQMTLELVAARGAAA